MKAEEFPNDPTIGGVSKCMSCSYPNLYQFLSLGLHPPSDTWLTANTVTEPESKFPLEVLFCEQCKLVQLSYIAPPELLFREFVYTSGLNITLLNDFHELATISAQRFDLTPRDLVVDIGSNDGTALKQFAELGVRVLGVEPAHRVALMAKERGIPTVEEFFNLQISKRLVKEYGRAKAVTAMNVFAHVRELHSFVLGVEELLDQKGVFIIETHYLLDLIEKMEYDSIYLEHLRVYSLGALVTLFNKYGLQVFDADRITTHGGSLRVFVCRKRDYAITDSVGKLLEVERVKGLYDKNTFIEFGKRVLLLRDKLSSILRQIKSEGKSIAGLGAPAKGNTLLNACNVDRDVIDYLAEPKGSLKIGRFAPGTHIPVVEESIVFEKQPDYLLLLSWNLREQLIPKLRQRGFRGKIIVPNPEPIVIATDT